MNRVRPRKPIRTQGLSVQDNCEDGLIFPSCWSALISLGKNNNLQKVFVCVSCVCVCADYSTHWQASSWRVINTPQVLRPSIMCRRLNGRRLRLFKMRP